MKPAQIVQTFDQRRVDLDRHPDFKAGDTVIVHVKVKEGDRQRIQAFKGLVIARRGKTGYHASFTVRKISFNEGVERTFHLYSEYIDRIEVVRRGRVRRAKIYYIRERSGRAMRIAERIVRKDKSAAAKTSS